MADIIDIQIYELIKKVKQSIDKIDELENKIKELQGLLDTLEKAGGKRRVDQ